MANITVIYSTRTQYSLMKKAMDITHNKSFWDNKYSNNDTGWDIGSPSTPLKEYIDQIQNKNIKILIPGCGNSYEAEYLLDSGFSDITLIDIADKPISLLRQTFKGRKEIHIVHGDFFKLSGQYDLILEQTFFCAIDPSLRSEYVNHAISLLNPNGKLAGVMFNCDFNKEGPPYRGNVEEYQKLFEEQFVIRTMTPCYNSIPPRFGNEVFVIFEKA